MLTRERKAHLVDLLKAEGRIIAKDVAEQLAVSEDTIRRDLRDLAAAGLLQRVHGGALPTSPALGTLAERRRISDAGKASIGRLAASMVRPGWTIIIDGGTTAQQMARSLPLDLAATVITHSPSVAVELADHPRIEIILIGGRIYKHSMVTTGATAIEAISRLNADAFFMGAAGVHAEAGLTTGDFEEAAIKRALSRAAAETIVLASSEKIGTASPFVIQPIREAATVITDGSAAIEALQAIRACGVAVVEAGGT